MYGLLLVVTEHATSDSDANVTGIHDNEELPLHILLLTHSVSVEGLWYM